MSKRISGFFSLLAAIASLQLGCATEQRAPDVDEREHAPASDPATGSPTESPSTDDVAPAAGGESLSQASADRSSGRVSGDSSARRNKDVTAAIGAQSIAEGKKSSGPAPSAPPPSRPLSVAQSETRNQASGRGMLGGLVGNEGGGAALFGKSGKGIAVNKPAPERNTEPKRDQKNIADKSKVWAELDSDERAVAVDPREDSLADDVKQGGGFAAVNVNPWVRVADDAQSTFAIDVDTASYTFARRFLERGQRPPEGAIRVEEFINAFHYDYDAPKSDAFRVHVAAAPSPLGGNKHLVRVALKGKELDAKARKPVHLTFLVDVSGSMSAADKLPLARASLHTLVNNLRDDDSVALVTYAGGTRVILEQTKVKNKDAIHGAIDRLSSGGGTAMGSGMELAYKNAHRYLSSGSESRVVVLSDGDANIGRTSHQEMLKSVRGYVSEGVTLSTVGFGTGNYQDHLMEQLANAGNGNYSYIDSQKAANKVFGEDLLGTLQVIAQDVKIQVEWNADTVKRYRLLGYENRDIADHDFRNDKVDAGEIGSGHTVTALYEVELRSENPSVDEKIATVRVRAKTPRGIKAKETAMEMTGAHIAESTRELDVDSRFAMATALAAEVLRGSPHAEGYTLADAALLAEDAVSGKYETERREFVNLLRRTSKSDSVATR